MSDGEVPDENATISFRCNIWSVPVTHTKGDWYRDVERSCESLLPVEPIIIDKEDACYAVSSLAKCKAPSPDGLHNFWFMWFLAHMRF